MPNVSTRIVSLLVAFVFSAPVVFASGPIMQTVAYGAGKTAVDGAIAANLIRTGQNSLASVSANKTPSGSPTFTTAGLNDGSAANNNNLAYYDNTLLPVVITFTLNTNSGTGGSASGYDITSLQAISGWTDSNLANQKFQVLFSINGGPFLDYGTYAALTATNGGANSILTTLTASTGPTAMARGVTAIQFVLSAAGGTQAGNGGVVIHELQAFGSATVTNPSTTPYRIVAVGDSITGGYVDNPNWTVPYQFGYRSGLLGRLVNAGVPFKFVGGSPEPWNGFSGTPTNMPNPDLRLVGQEGAEGFGGRTTAFVLGNMKTWLAVDQPDILLLMIGINDIGQGSTAEPTGTEQNLSNIVATVVSKSPNTRVIVAQITPYASYTDAITKYNNYIANSLVPYFIGQGKFVTTVNQYTNLCTPGTTNIDATLFANGINHPNNAVYDKMAQTWFAGIQALSLPAPQTSTANENLVANGSFEAPWLGASTHNVNAAGTGWTFTTGLSGAGSGIDNGNAYGTGGTNSYDGNQRACLQASGNSSVMHLSQAVSGFTVGQFYQLSFWAKGIGAFTGANPFKVSVSSGSFTNTLFSGATITPSTTGFTLYTSAPFQATNTVMTLDFADLAPGAFTYVSWIDGVSINPVSGINLLANGGFEAPTFALNSHNVNPATSYGWTFTSGISGAGSGIDNNDPYGNNGASSVEYAGSQHGCLQSSGNSTVISISQTVSNLTVGQYYQVSFLAKSIAGFSGGDPFRVSTIFGSATNILFGGADVLPPNNGYQLYTSAPFQASAATMTLTFADRGLSSAAFVTMLDNVSLYAVAAPTILVTPQAGSTVSSLDSAIAVNLIRNGQASLSSVSASHGPSISTAFATTGLNDGSAVGNGNLTYYGNADPTGGNLPVTITFILNTNSQTGGGSLGYVVTNVQAISGWSDSYLANQSFQLLFSLNGGAFTNYGTYECFNYLNGGNNSVLQSVQRNGSALASNVTAVQFIFQTPMAPQAGSGGTLLRELQVFGTIANRPPTAQSQTLSVPMAGSNNLQIIGGKHPPTDADGDALIVSAVTQGLNGIVSFTSTNVTYTSTNSASSDTFTYTVSDNRGGLDTKTVTVAIYNPEGYNRLSPPSVIGAGTVTLSYLGIPGYQYALDWATNLTPPINWMSVATNTAANNGMLSYTNTSSAPANFFRTRYAP